MILSMILWCINECDWSVVKSVDKNCPPLKFVGPHGVSYFGHKRPKMLKNSELQASRVATSLGQCGHIDTSTTLSLSLLILFCIYWVHLLYLGMVSKKSKNDNEEESQVLRCFFKMYFRLPLFVVWVKRCQVVCRRQIRTRWNLGSSYQRFVSTEQSHSCCIFSEALVPDYPGYKVGCKHGPKKEHDFAMLVIAVRLDD